MDFATPAAALAVRYTAAICPAPANTAAIRTSSATPDVALPPTPCVLVFLDAASFRSGGSGRAAAVDYLVRFYYAEATDLGRDATALLAWAGVLAQALKGATQLAGAVDTAILEEFSVGLLPYAGRTYSGIELKVTVGMTEGWVATA